MTSATPAPADNEAAIAGVVVASGPRAGAWAALALLLSMNLLNYVDRQVMAAVEWPARRDLLPGDPHAGAKMGSLAMAFLVSYMVAAPLFGWLAERRSRWLLIAAGIGLWSIASGASGLAMTFAVLFFTRCLVGVGEAAYAPAAPAILSDLYPLAVRGKVLTWLYMAIPVGSALGYVLGGYMAAWNPAAQSWRWAFFAAMIPGLLLGILSLRMREQRRGAAENAELKLAPLPAHRNRFRDYLTLWRTPSYVLDTVGMTCMTFSVGAIGWWMPRYLKLHDVQPVLGLEPAVFLGAISAVAGITGTLSGGLIGDACRARWPGAYFLVSGAAMLACVPCFLLFLALPFPAAWVLLFLAEFLLFFNTGPTNTILANVTHPVLRTTAFGLNILVIHALGDAFSPMLVGAIEDISNLTIGFVAVSGLMAVGGVVWLYGARHLAADTSAAEVMLETGRNIDERPAG